MTVRARWLLTVLVALVWVVLPAPAGDVFLAMPPLLAAVAYAAAAYAGYITVAQAVIAIAVMVYGAVNARETARRARNQARDAYNASLQDRLATVMSTQAPWQVVYGEAVVGGAIVALLTSGDKDQYKHVVVVWAAHECEAITEFYVNGYPAGARDADGNVLYGKYAVGETDTVTVDAVVSGTGAINLVGVVGAQRVLSVSDGGSPPYTLAGSECTLTGSTVQIGPTHVAYWAGKSVRVTVDLSATSSRLRVRHFLGSADQAADGMTMAECPDWTSTDRLRGLCYSIVRLDLNEQEFQGGPPQMTARVKGRKVHDPRTGTTAWSANPALCIADFLQAEWGKQALSTQLVTSSVIASANACDEDLVLHYGKRYTCNGAFRTDSDPDETLNALAQSMAGFVTYTGAWHLQAGVWTAPVMDLGDAQNAGAVQGVAGDSALQVFNGLRGQFFDPARADQLTDYPPYRNAGFVAEDGGELWENLPLPFTDSDWRAHNLARIHVERSRGMTLVVPCKRVALKLRVGQRVRYSNSLLQIAAQPFRVVKREYRLGQPVMLTLAQDAEDFYDEVDAPAPLSSPAVYEADPFRVAAVAGLSAQSGSTTLLLQSDGTVLSRVRVMCSPAEDALVLRGGALQVEWRREQDAVWQRAPEASGVESEAWLQGLKDGQLYVVRARWRNALGVVGDWRSTTVLHLGKLDPPAPVAGLSATVIPGAVRIAWTPSSELDYAKTLLRVGASWVSGTPLALDGPASSYDWLWPPLSSYTIWAAHVDTSGNVGLPVSVAVTVDSAILLGADNTTGGGNLIDLGWWRQDASIPWPANGEYNRLVNTSPSGGADLGVSGPRGGNDTVWYCQEVTGDSNNGGGWDAPASLTLDPSRAYRFVVPIRVMDTVGGAAYWGVQASTVTDLNTTTVNDNPYFAVMGHTTMAVDRWYLFVGFVYPAGSTGNSHDSAGVWDCKTGAKVMTGLNFCHRASAAGVTGHRAYQFYAVSGERQLFGRPMVNVVDGTEPSLREYFEPGAVLNSVLVPSITAAQAAADAAQGTASAAASNASTALSTLATMRSNGYIDASEKPALIRAWQAIYDERGGIYDQASAMGGLNTQRDAYYAAFAALNSYLSGLSPSWNDTSTDTPITPAVDQAKWAAYYAARQTLLNAIADEASKRAQWDQVGGSGKPLDNAGRTVDLGTGTHFGARNRDDPPSEYPYGRLQQFKESSYIGLSSADGAYCTLETIIQYHDDSGGPNVQYAYQGAKTWRRSALRSASSWGAWTQDLDRNAYTGALDATRNSVTYSSSAPSSPADGDIWIDTSVTPRTIRMRLGGTWQLAGTYVNGTAQLLDDANLGLTALWSGVTGTGKPADYATRNQVFFQDGDPVSSPGGVVDGAIWVSSTKAWQRAGGAWRPYVGNGSVDTGQLSNAAATDVTVVTLTAINLSNAA